MELQQLGYFSKTHGVKGQLVLRPERDFDSERTKALFVEVGGAKAPYFIAELSDVGNNVLVKLEEVDSVEKARVLVGKAVYLEVSLFLKEEEEEDWTGFELVDKQFGSLGRIRELSDNGAQVLASLHVKDREVILPLAEELIEKVDATQQIIFYNAPEGLIDVYLGGEGEK